MDTGAQVLLLCDPFQEFLKPGSFSFAEAGTEILLMLPGNAPDRFELGRPARCQAQGVRAPVVRARVTFEESAPRHVVEEEDETARKDAEPVGELSLGHPGLAAKDAKNARVRRGEPQGGQPLREPKRRMRTDLGEQEGGPCSPAPWLHSY